MSKMNTRESYWCGVMLSASRNSQNRIQFLIVPDSTGFTLLSRTCGFNKPWDEKKSSFVERHKSRESILRTIASYKSKFRERGLSVPFVEVFDAERVSRVCEG